MSQKFNKAAAYDYHFTGLTIDEIAKKHDMPFGTVSYSKNKFPALDFKDPEVAPIDSLILINETDLERIVFLMKEYHIKYRIPVEFNLDLKFNSKINN